MRPLTILLIAISFMLTRCAVTKTNTQPIKAKIDFIQRDNDSITIYAKHRRLHNNSGYDIFVAKFSKIAFIDTLTIGKMITLYPKMNADTCQYVFQPIKK